MRKSLAFLVIFSVVLYTVIAFIAYQVTFPLIKKTNLTFTSRYYDYSGVTHVHTGKSTGSGTLEEVVTAASQANCGFVIVTDLNSSLEESEIEGYKEGVLFIKGGEFSFLAGHLLSYNLPDTQAINGPGQNQIFFGDMLAREQSKSVTLIAAHPLLPNRGWNDLSMPGLHGMEILNLDSIWQKQIQKNKLSILWSFLILPFNPDLSYLRLFSDNEDEIRIWDSILKKRMFFGFAGNDTRANVIPYPGESIKIPSYYQSFKIMKNHLLLKSELTGAYQEDREKVLGALHSGSFYMSLDVLGDPAGFFFSATQQRRDFLPGKTLKLSGGSIKMVVELGRELDIPFEVLVFKDGERVKISNSRTLEFNVDGPGAYRVVVRVIPTLPVPDGKQWYPWIYSNAIRVVKN